MKPLIYSVVDPTENRNEVFQEYEDHIDNPSLQPGQRRYRSYLNPRWYIREDTGVLEPIQIDAASDTDPVDGESAYSETRNTLQFRTNANGVSTYRRFGHVLRTRFEQVRVEDATTEVLRTSQDTVRPTTFSKPEVHKIRAEQVTNYIDVEHSIYNGHIKTNLVLQQPPDNALVDAENVYFIWQWDCPSLTPVLENGEIRWKDTFGRAIFVFKTPVAWDNTGYRLRPIRYFIRAGRYAVGVKATELRDAVYPVVIDPTYTTDQADAVANNVVGEEAGSHDTYDKAHVRITLPDMSGATPTEATINLYVESTGLSQACMAIYCDIAKLSGSPYAWVDTTTAANMNSLTYNAALGTQTMQPAVGNWHSMDILGTYNTNGIAKAYYDDSTPDPITVKMHSDTVGSSTLDTKFSGIELDDDGNRRCRWSNRSNASTYPYIEIITATTVTATGAIDLGSGMTVSGDAFLSWFGVGDINLPAFDLDADATNYKEAIGAIDLIAMTVDGATALTRVATGDIVLPAFQVDGVGDLDPLIKTATGAITFGAMTVDGDAGIQWDGAGAIDLFAFQVDGQATRIFWAAADISQPAFTVAGSASKSVFASGAISMAAWLVNGVTHIADEVAEADIVFRPMEVAGTVIRKHSQTGGGDFELTAMTVEGVGYVLTTYTADGSISFPGIQVGGETTVKRLVTASGAIVLPAFNSSGVGLNYTTIAATGAIDLSAFELSGQTSTLFIQEATGDPTLPAFRVAGQAARVVTAIATIELTAFSITTATSLTWTAVGTLTIAPTSPSGTVIRQSNAAGEITIPALEPSGTAKDRTHEAIGTIAMPAFESDGMGVRGVVAVGAIVFEPGLIVLGNRLTRKATGAITLPAFRVFLRPAMLKTNLYRVVDIDRRAGTGDLFVYIEAINRPIEGYDKVTATGTIEFAGQEVAGG